MYGMKKLLHGTWWKSERRTYPSESMLMATVTDLLQLIYKKLDEILHVITKNRGAGDEDEPKPEPISQEKFNTAMDEVVKEVNKRGRAE